MKVQVLFNNEAISGDLSAGWGFSCLVNKYILFDTGESEKYLFKNMKNMGIDISDIEAVVISHNHWDHTGGLWELLNAKRGLKVYACPNFSREFNNKVKELKGELVTADKFTKVAKDIYTTGEIQGEYKGQDMPEQALVVKTKNGITAITGCAHPGIIKIVEKIKSESPSEQFYLVFGGFHLMNKDKRTISTIVDTFKELGIKKVGPTHCSGKEAERIFEEKYQDNFISVKAGQILDI